ncbi:MAG: pyridoxine 5'-phosphate synthase [Alphaproteobacteria bacterium]|nr:pyridoxine 5'-phosphate synthase [Alphaproteobacteria bacterium]
MPAKLSVNINKYALLRNSRGHDAPNLLRAIDTCLAAGAHGITIHPRLDQRHIRYDDVSAVAAYMRARHPGVELNIECEDAERILSMVLAERPAQCTLVPVTPGEVTSDHGWDLPKETARLRPTVRRLQDAGIRVSIFMDCDPERMALAAEAGVDRVELYTGPYAWAWGTERQAEETAKVRESARAAAAAGLGVNAGHDLDQHNMRGLWDLDVLDEVSIGHAQICRALEVGTTQSVQELLASMGW